MQKTKTIPKTTVPNRLKEFHEHLRDTNAPEFKRTIKAICKDLDISLSSYYRKMEQPGRFFSNAERKAIAQVYGLPLHFLFTESE